MMARRCGNCGFGKMMPQDLTRRICWGAPPTPMQTVLPNGQKTVAMVRPIVAVTDDACALHQWMPAPRAMQPLEELSEEAKQ
jgi:hypothetical protein